MIQLIFSTAIKGIAYFWIYCVVSPINDKWQLIYALFKNIHPTSFSFTLSDIHILSKVIILKVFHFSSFLPFYPQQSGAFCGGGNSQVLISISIETRTLSRCPWTAGWEKASTLENFKKTKKMVFSWYLQGGLWPTLFIEWKKRWQIVREQIEFVEAGKVKWRKARHKGSHSKSWNRNLSYVGNFLLFFQG